MPNQATRIELVRHGAVLVVRVVGYYTRDIALRVRNRVNAALEEHGAVKVLLDIRGSVQLLTDDEWARLSQELSLDPIRASMGILVNEDDLSQCWSRCDLASRGGRIRLPFCDHLHAARWAGISPKCVGQSRRFQPISEAG